MKRREGKVYDVGEIYKLTDLIILFIGISVILLGLLSLFVSIPEEYVVGATIGGMFFVLADVVVLNDVIKTKDLVFHILSLFVGVISFFGLPVLIIAFPSVKEDFLEFSNFATFLALGCVLMALSYKAVMRKDAEQKRLEDEMNALKKELEKLKEKSNE